LEAFAQAIINSGNVRKTLLAHPSLYQIFAQNEHHTDQYVMARDNSDNLTNAKSLVWHCDAVTEISPNLSV
jgi:hypothetical protein